MFAKKRHICQRDCKTQKEERYQIQKVKAFSKKVFSLFSTFFLLFLVLKNVKIYKYYRINENNQRVSGRYMIKKIEKIKRL